MHSVADQVSTTGHTGSPATLAPGPRPGSLRGRTVVFLHAHPDDEAIFTAATMHRLAAAGARVVLVTATAGELGPVLAPLRAGETLAGRRRAELERACAALGVARLVLLGHRDSGMAGWDSNAHPAALARADLAAAGRRLAGLCLAEGAEALVHYDGDGIYRHPDHLAVHRVGAAAAVHARVSQYQATVDRDHLGGRGRHLVEAAAAGHPGVGRGAGQITTVVAAGAGGLAAKRAAMAAHASQIRPATLHRRGFARTYGLEWYVRTGPPAALDELSELAAAAG
jgi:LmbE family N-acetylglucosaminyl deacetylase